MKRIILSLCILKLGFLASLSSVSAQESGVGLEECKGYVDFLIGREIAGTYRYKTGESKLIIWPIRAPGGIEMTRAWPIEKDRPGESNDHKHHQSVWFCHGDVIPEGIQLKHKLRGIVGVDFWSVHDGHGRIVCTKLKKGESGKNWNSIVTENEWRTADGQKILDEKRIVSLYDFGKARLWVFDIDLHASVCPITFGDTKEGCMAIRVNDKISERRGNGMIQNAEGKQREKECWGRKSAWCDYSGTIDGKKVGIAILDDPNNPHPASWHARGYGLMAANPFGRQKARFPAVQGRTDLVRLDKGEHLHLRFGVLVHTGDTESGNVAEFYQRFVQLGAKKK